MEWDIDFDSSGIHGSKVNLTTDAHLSALAIEQNAELFSDDQTFGGLLVEVAESAALIRAVTCLLLRPNSRDVGTRAFVIPFKPTEGLNGPPGPKTRIW